MAGTLGTITGQVRLDIRQAVASYAALRAQNARTTYALRGTGDAFIASGQQMMLMGGAMVYGFAKVVNAAAEFERKMDYAAAVSGTTGKAMQKLSDYALQLGKDTIYSAGEIADGFIELAKAGVSSRQIINGIGEAMANLGAAGDIPLMESGQIITSTIQQFDMSARDAVKVTDLLAGAANASIADITDIGVSLKYVGGVANAAGLDFEDTATAISLLAKAGIRGSTAGTSLRQMIVSLGGATGPAREALAELGILTEDGNNKFFDAQGNAKSLSDVFQILQDSTADLTNKQRLMYLRTIFNNRALSAASILTRDGAKGFREMNKEMSKVTAAEVASQRLDNLSGDLEILRGNIETLMIEAGSPFQEELRRWVQRLTELVQAFSDLDPATQTMIYRLVAISGAALIVMGAINMVIGVIFKFIAHALKMAAGVKFLANLIRIVAVNAKWAAWIFGGMFTGAVSAAAAALGITVGALLAIVAAVVAVGVGLIILYKKWEPFRNIVDKTAAALWKGIKAIGAFFKALVTDPGKAWDMLKSGMSDLGGFAEKVGGWIVDGLKIALDYIGQWAGRAVDWFVDMGTRALSAIGDFAVKLASLFTFRNIGYALGYLLGVVTKFFSQISWRMLEWTLRAVAWVTGQFAKLAPKIGYYIGWMVGKAIALMIKMHSRIGQITAKLIMAVIKFFAKLPGRVNSFLRNMVVRGISLMVSFGKSAPKIAAQLVAAVIEFFAKLPGRAAAFFTQLVSKTKTLLGKAKTAAIDLAKGLFEGFKNGIAGLPNAVSGILGRVIGAIKAKITEGFNAVKGFASGMWKGFKEGLGINSPSLIEKQMFQMTRVTGEETKKIQKNALRMQGIAKKVANTKFGPLNPAASDTASQYRRLASMQRANQNRARMMMDSAGTRQARVLAGPNRRTVSGNKKMKLEITNWRTGEGYFYGIAQDAIDDTEYYEDTFERMD